MTDFTIWNTLSRKKETFRPIDACNVRMYVCGPTVYDRAHIGNARPAVVFDVVYRLLQHIFGTDCVTYVRNITDIDDKINDKGLKLKEAGDTRDLIKIIKSVTDETIRWYHEDMAFIGVDRPTHEPRATEFIPPMIDMIKQLIAGGYAYESAAHVLFDVSSYNGYGDLSNRSLEDMRAGARVEVAPYKKNDLDFVLWKPSHDDLPGWNSPWGWGRPGWHIECSAMSSQLLGDCFDLHGGGADLCFPHHENEMAQSRCVHNKETFANYWMHNGMIRVNGQKMAKSRNNFFTIQDLRKQSMSGHAMRLVILGTHYRQPLDWTDQKAHQANQNVSRWKKALLASDTVEPEIDEEFLAALCDDLNTPQAISRLHRLTSQGAVARLKGSLALLGFAYPMGKTHENRDGDENLTSSEQAWINELICVRNDYRQNKNYSGADRIRSQLERCGVTVNDRPGSGETGWSLDEGKFDRARLERLVSELDEESG